MDSVKNYIMYYDWAKDNNSIKIPLIINFFFKFIYIIFGYCNPPRSISNLPEFKHKKL